MPTPTHVQVIVLGARNLILLGKNGTSNDVFVKIALGKEKYRTSIKENAPNTISWSEECLLPIPKQGNKEDVILTVLHRTYLGADFIGCARIHLSEFDVHGNPNNKWYTLGGKGKSAGKASSKPRGELQVRIGFTTAAGDSDKDSDKLLPLSVGQMSSQSCSESGTQSRGQSTRSSFAISNQSSSENLGNSCDDWDEKFFGKMNSRRGSSHLSIPNGSRRSSFAFSLESRAGDTFDEPIPKPRQRLSQDFQVGDKEGQQHVQVQTQFLHVEGEDKPPKSPRLDKARMSISHFSKEAKGSLTSIFGSKSKLNETDKPSSSSAPPTPPVGVTMPMRGIAQLLKNVTPAIAPLPIPPVDDVFDGLSRNDLIDKIDKLEMTLETQRERMNDLETYVDKLLVKILETDPIILQSSSSDEDLQSAWTQIKSNLHD